MAHEIIFYKLSSCTFPYTCLCHSDLKHLFKRNKLIHKNNRQLAVIFMIYYTVEIFYTSNINSPYVGIGQMLLSTTISSLSTGARNASIATLTVSL